MIKKTFQKKTKYLVFLIAVFIFFIPNDNLYAQGPGSPEAAGFEPVDASDMVSLTTGDMSYVLPLLSIDGFPINLSYHAGITTDLEASWVGLGWYLNPGAINRSLANTPDDWKNGVGIDFTAYNKSETYFGITADIGFANSAQVGVGVNWGAGKGMSGSVRASLGFNVGEMVNAGVSVSADTNGNVGVGLSAGVSLGSYGAGASYSYSITGKKGSFGIGAGVKTAEDSFAGVGASFSSDGFSIGASVNQKNPSNDSSASGGVGIGSSSFSSGDMSIEQQTQAFAIPVYIGPISLTLGFSKKKVKYSLRKGFYKHDWGALYASDFSDITSNGSQAGTRDGFSDYQERTNSFDVYSTRLPQNEEVFIADQSKDIENINFTYVGYDDYQVNAQGLSGSMTPRLLQNTTIFGKGDRTQNEYSEDLHVFWQHGENTTNNVAQRQFGTGNNNLHFYFDGQLTSRETVIPSSVNTNPTKSSINSFVQGGGLDLGNSFTDNNSSNRAKSPNYIEVFTNRQIASGYAQAKGLITPTSIPNADRLNIAKFDPDGIGAYKITSADGKTYHFALPVYHFEQVQRSLIESNEESPGRASNVSEKRQYSKYATHWLLTAVTGSDYIDNPNTGVQNKPDSSDYGYWVELDYGKWSDGYVWRSPHDSRINNYNTNLVGNIEDKDKGYYQFGRKQLYYLDQIRTRNQTAIFIKDIRYDAVGKDLSFSLANNNGNYNDAGLLNTSGENNGMNATQNIFVQEDGVHYKREYSLKLKKIVLFKTEVAQQLTKDNSGSLGSSIPSSYAYLRDDKCKPNWQSPYFRAVYGSDYEYSIHNESAVFDINDVSNQFIAQNALRVIELDTDYSLAKNSEASSELPASLTNYNKGRLTLNKVFFKGKGGTEYMPPYKFEYYLEEMSNIVLTDLPSFKSSFFNTITPDHTAIENYVTEKRNNVDSWGFLKGSYNGVPRIKGWNLKEITTPTGGTVTIDYEEDDYWTEAFARRYWENDLQIAIYDDPTNSAYKQIHIQNQTGSLSTPVKFDDYFIENQRTFVDLCIHRYRRWRTNFCSQRESTGLVRLTKDDNVTVVSATNSLLILRFLNNNGQYSVWGDDSSGNLNRFFDKAPSSRFNELPDCQRPPTPSGGCGSNPADHHNMKYKLLANKVPEDETGGGLRVKELITKDLDNTYRVTYDYKHPTKGRSSGITSYAPVDGLKYVPYQTELPAPGVMYEYVTMTEKTASGDFDSQTRYRNYVLQPVYDIFNPNISMDAMDANAVGEDKIFWATVEENFGGIDGSTANKKTVAKKIDININTALIGQIKSVENLNSQGHILLKKENEYINGRNLNFSEPNKGYISESFNSMKTIFNTNKEGTVIDDSKTKRLLSISTKTDYNNMLKKSITISGGHKTYTEYFDVDPWLGGFRKSETTMANGTKTQSIRIPAYEKYTGMQSKVLNPNNKNMLTQEAMNITNVQINGNWLTSNANVTTWKDSWSHVTNNGQTNTLGGLWRKHQNFVWKDNVDANGTYGQQVNTNSFNWSIGAIQTNTQWQKVSEITKYTLWSLPVEAMDINGNFAASKMADKFSKTIATSNARYDDMYYSGAEYVDNGNLFEGEVLGANYRTPQQAHTGKWSVKNSTLSDKIFEINKTVNSNVTANAISPGDYRVSFWVKENNAINNPGVTLTSNGVAQPVSETVEAGCWKQYNYYINISASATNLNLDVKALGTVDNYFDDFRMHPVASSMSSYVYNQDTDELMAILGANNMASVFCYDAAGRLCTTYTEVANQGNNIGGFKATSKNKYNYQGISNNNAGCDCIVDHCNDTDIDKDGVVNSNDNCPNDFNTNQADDDNDGIGDVCDTFKDKDGDGIMDSIDNCPTIYNPYQQDDDLDKIGNACDSYNSTDIDNDGILNAADNCPTTYNLNQLDTDSDNIGDFCDSDIDGDGISNGSDYCAAILNYQGLDHNEDSDNDGIGDYCDCDTFKGYIYDDHSNTFGYARLGVLMNHPYFDTLLNIEGTIIFDPARYKFEWSVLTSNGTFTSFVIGNQEHEFSVGSLFCDQNQQVYGPKYAAYCRVTDLYTNCQVTLFYTDNNCSKP